MMANTRTTAGARENKAAMNTHLFSLLLLILLLAVSPLMAREIRQAPFSLLHQTVRLAAQEPFVLTSTPSLRHSACEKKTAQAKQRCALPVVQFQLGSAKLSPSEQDSLLAGLNQCTLAPGTQLIVTGHACALGTESRNRDLSQQRAEQVAAVLRAHGYSVAEVRAMGSQQPLPGNKPLATNRRVAITLAQQ